MLVIPQSRESVKTFEVEVTVPADRRLTIELPEDMAIGSYQVVVVMNPVPISDNGHSQLHELAGQVQSFAEVDAVDWQQQERAGWDD